MKTHPRQPWRAELLRVDLSERRGDDARGCLPRVLLAGVLVLDADADHDALAVGNADSVTDTLDQRDAQRDADCLRQQKPERNALSLPHRNAQHILDA